MAELKKRHEFWLALLIVVLFCWPCLAQRRVSDIR